MSERRDYIKEPELDMLVVILRIIPWGHSDLWLLQQCLSTQPENLSNYCWCYWYNEFLTITKEYEIFWNDQIKVKDLFTLLPFSVISFISFIIILISLLLALWCEPMMFCSPDVFPYIWYSKYVLSVLDDRNEYAS